ncbi:MAG: PH domain-containing protein [Candidatus Hydrogenedentes bacterium]|nr:PH domain-containing protein [Candidatus Hydrogenedentota bacterium]
MGALTVVALCAVVCFLAVLVGVYSGNQGLAIAGAVWLAWASVFMALGFYSVGQVLRVSADCIAIVSPFGRTRTVRWADVVEVRGLGFGRFRHFIYVDNDHLKLRLLGGKSLELEMNRFVSRETLLKTVIQSVPASARIDPVVLAEAGDKKGSFLLQQE